MSKYINIKDFRQMTRQIVESIRSKVNKSDIPVYFTINVFKDGKPTNWSDEKVMGITLTDLTPKIYSLNKENVNSSTIVLNISFRAEELHMNENRLDLTDESYTFKTYREYLEFFTTRFERIYPDTIDSLCVFGIFKNCGIGLSSILSWREYVSRRGCVSTDGRYLTPSDFANLKLYNVLPEKVRKAVDEEFFPLTIHRDDVEVYSETKSIKVYIDTPEKIEKQFLDTQYDDIVKGIFDEITNQQ